MTDAVEFRRTGKNDGKGVYATEDGRYRAMYHARETTGAKRSPAARSRGREPAGEWIVTDRTGGGAAQVGSGAGLDAALRDFTSRTGHPARLVRGKGTGDAQPSLFERAVPSTKRAAASPAAVSPAAASPAQAALRTYRLAASRRSQVDRGEEAVMEFHLAPSEAFDGLSEEDQAEAMRQASKLTAKDFRYNTQEHGVILDARWLSDVFDVIVTKEGYWEYDGSESHTIDSQYSAYLSDPRDGASFNSYVHRYSR